MADVSQTTPIDTNTRYINVTREVAEMLGLGHLVIGMLCIIFQIVSIAFATSTSSFGAPGIWTGSLFAVTGVLGIIAGRRERQRCQVITFNVLSIISAAFSLILLGFAAQSAVNAFSVVYNTVRSFNKSITAFVMEMLLIALAFVELIIALCPSVVSCMPNVGEWCADACPSVTRCMTTMGEWCDDVCPSVTRCMTTMGEWCVNFRVSCYYPTDQKYRQFDNPVQPDLVQQQLIATDQQQPVGNTNQQQQVLNPNQQQQVLNPNQQQLMSNTNQLQPVFNTNPQQLTINTALQQPVFNSDQQQLLFNPSQPQSMFNTNQHQPTFSPNQQLLLFNPSQQQLMCFPIQPITGVNSEQQAVQYYVLQPNTPLSSQQAEFSGSLSGATDQGSVAGLHSQLLTAPLLEAITEPPPSDNTSDDGPAFTDDVEVVSREGPNDDSENRL